MKRLWLLLLLSLTAYGQVNVLVSKNPRGNTTPGSYRKGALVEVRPNSLIGNKEPTAFYIIHVTDADPDTFDIWLENDTTDTPGRGRKLYRMKTAYVNSIDTYDTLSLAAFTSNVVPKDQGWLYEDLRLTEPRWASVVPDQFVQWWSMLQPATATSATVITGGGGDYVSLNAAEAGEQKDLVTATETLTINCIGGADATAVTFLGWTTNATYFPTANGENQSAATVGVWDSGIYRLDGTGSPLLDIRIKVFKMNNFQIKSTGTYVIWTRPAGGSENHTYQNSLIIGATATTGTGITGITSQPNPGIVNVINCVFYDLLEAFRAPASWVSYLNNNTFFNTKSCIDAAGADVTIKNNLYQSNSISGATGYEDTFAAASDYNLSDIAADAPGANSINSATVTFQNAAGGDFRLADADASGAKEGGDDLSADTPSVTDDIQGTTRTVPYSIGAFEYVAAAAVADEDQDGFSNFKKFKRWKQW